MSTPRLRHLDQNLARATDLVGLGQAVGGMTHGLVDATEMYRAAWMLAVGAMDTYVHGVVLDRAVEIVVGRSAGGSLDHKIGLHLSAVREIVSAASPADREMAARSFLAQRLSLETFQKPDDVARALALVNVPKIWSNAFANSEAAKTSLSLAVRRRNAIVHQCDSDPLSPAVPTPMLATDALEVIEVIRRTASGIDALL